APAALRKTFPARGWLLDLARDIANRTVGIDPLMSAVYRRSAVTLCKTRETLLRIPARFRDRCRLQIELGTDQPAAADGPRASPRGDGVFRVLYVGRLVYWKGLHLGLMAFARLLRTHPRATLTVIGSGAEEEWLRGIACGLGVGASVTWVPRMEQAKVM